MNYFQSLWAHLRKGIDKPQLAMYWFFAGIQLMILIYTPFSWVTIVAFFGSLIGYACVVYMASANPINGLLGLLSAGCFIAVNIEARHWWSILVQLVFVACLDVPLLFNLNGWSKKTEKKGFQKLKLWQWAVLFVFIGITWAIACWLGFLLHDSQPITDSLVLALGLWAAILWMWRFKDNYTLWILSDIINVVMWGIAAKEGISPASVSILCVSLAYFANAIYGRFFSVWQKGVQQ